jgi:hypothetical protein
MRVQRSRWDRGRGRTLSRARLLYGPAPSDAGWNLLLPSGPDSAIQVNGSNFTVNSLSDVTASAKQGAATTAGTTEVCATDGFL